jgi:hypothetical protein
LLLLLLLLLLLILVLLPVQLEIKGGLQHFGVPKESLVAVLESIALSLD